MRSNLMILCWALVTIAGWSPLGWAQEAVLSTDRTSYLLHEPVELRIDFINRGKAPIRKELPSVELSVSQPSGRLRRVKLWQNQIEEAVCKRGPWITIQPGESGRQTMWVAMDYHRHWIFSKAGRWQIGVTSLAAAAIEIEVLDPSAGETKDAIHLFNRKACDAFLQGRYDDDISEPILQEVVDKQPRTTFALFAGWTLVQNPWSQGSLEKHDWAKEHARLTMILHGPQDHPLRPAAMYALVRHHGHQNGHEEQAKKAAEALVREYPWSNWARTACKENPDFGLSAKPAPYSDDPAVARRREVAGKPGAAATTEKP